MAQTKQDEELKEKFSDKVREFQEYIFQGRPYVWKLKLSEEDFYSLESLIQNSINSHKGSFQHLICPTFVLYLLIYFAEWYKRIYKGKETGVEEPVLSLDTEDRKQLWALSGINSNVFVYNASSNPDKPLRRWKESMEILGGLPVRYELNRSDKDSFLLRLCKIYHGESIDIEDLEERERAVAFQKSISEKHSLYYFIASILNGDYPFALSDLEDKNSDINNLISHIKNADWLARQEKFEFEWLITYDGQHNIMTRKLKVNLKAEEIGGKYKNYIGYERLREIWNIPNPELVSKLEFDLRFKDGNSVIKNASFQDPLMTYINTGSESVGFVAGSIRDGDHIPTQSFTEIELVMRYDGHTRIVQSLDYKGYLQVYKVPKSINEWTSTKRNQAQTSLIFSSRFRLKDTKQKEQCIQLPFIDGDNKSEDMNWCPIYDVITLVDDHDRDVVPSFYNRNGYYQVLTKKYLNTIKYKDNLYVTYKYIELNNEDELVNLGEEDYNQGALPLLFGKEGLQVRYYPSMASAEWQPIESYDLEFMGENGRYIPWNEYNEPKQGKVRLRVTVKGSVCITQVFYVPFITTDSTPEPIWRDFNNQKIRFGISGKQDIQDSFPHNFHKADETIHIELGPRHSRALIDVYRPIVLRELYQSGKLVSYHSPEEPIEIPLLFADQFAIRDFNKDGVVEYDLRDLKNSYYSFPNFGENVNPSDSLFLKERKVQDIDPTFSLENLKLYFTKALEKKENLFQWDYKKKLSPIKDGEDADIQSGIIFQSMRGRLRSRHYAMPQYRFDNDGWDFDDDEVYEESDPLTCFKVASDHKVYYSIFKSLREVVNDNKQIEKIILPLITLSKSVEKSTFTKNIIESLYRFSVEFHFDWMLLKRDIWIEAIEEVATKEEDVIWYRQQVEKFFKLSPKVSDDSERRSLNYFLELYWKFDDFSTTDPLAVKALRFILGDSENVLSRNEKWEDFLRQYDNCRYKFSEMSRILCKIDKH